MRLFDNGSIDKGATRLQVVAARQALDFGEQDDLGDQAREALDVALCELLPAHRRLRCFLRPTCCVAVVVVVVARGLAGRGRIRRHVIVGLVREAE